MSQDRVWLWEGNGPGSEPWFELNTSTRKLAKVIFHDPDTQSPIGIAESWQNQANLNYNQDVLIYSKDALGSITELTNPQGQLVQRRSYDEFGNLKAETSGPYAGAANRIIASHAFTGRPQDRGTYAVVSYHKARWYQPLMQRWMSPDPIGFGGGDANLYRYVGGSPKRFVDSVGLSYEAILYEVGSKRGQTYGGFAIIEKDDGTVNVALASTWPNATNGNPGISGGTYNASYSSKGLHQSSPAITLNGGQRISTVGPNSAQSGAYFANQIKVHFGASMGNRGSAGCPTISPDADDFFDGLMEGETGFVTIKR